LGPSLTLRVTATLNRVRYHARPRVPIADHRPDPTGNRPRSVASFSLRGFRLREPVQTFSTGNRGLHGRRGKWRELSRDVLRRDARGSRRPPEHGGGSSSWQKGGRLHCDGGGWHTRLLRHGPSRMLSRQGSKLASYSRTVPLAVGTHRSGQSPNLPRCARVRRYSPPTCGGAGWTKIRVAPSAAPWEFSIHTRT
jgi:hypothetical protein